MANTIKLRHKVGGTQAAPLTGSEGEVAFWVDGTGAAGKGALYFHDGVQWVDILPVVVKPSITAPAAGATAGPTNINFTSSPYSADPSLGTHASSDWQISTDPAFGTFDRVSNADTTNLVSWRGGVSQASTTYYARVRYRSSTGAVSGWSDAVSFTSGAEFRYPTPNWASDQTAAAAAIRSVAGYRFAANDAIYTTSQVTSLSDLFNGNTTLTQAQAQDVTSWDTNPVTSMVGMFNNCSGLTALDLTGLDTSAVTSVVNMFNGCSGLTALDVTGFNTGAVTSVVNMFNGCSRLTALDVTGFDTRAVASMVNMFYGCSGLTALDVTRFDTSAVMSMDYMFSGCSGLTALDVTRFDTSAVMSMRAMFSVCSGLTALDVTGFDTRAVTSMTSMFYGCSGLTALDLTSFDTSAVTSMQNMFFGCSKLTALDLSTFNTIKVNNMQAMFKNCAALSGIQISSWNVSSITNATDFMLSANAAINTTELDATLIAWAAQTVKPNVAIHFGNTNYTGTSNAAVGAAYTTLTTAPNNWVITAGTSV